MRYWHYDRDTNINGGGDIRLEFDVLDIEAVHYLEGRRANVAWPPVFASPTYNYAMPQAKEAATI